MNRTLSSAFGDMADGVRRYQVSMALAHEDVGDQHRRTVLGPAWLLINYLVYVGTFIVIFGGGQNTAQYAIYISTGLFAWVYLQDLITQSTRLFKREEAFISGTTLPLSVYVLRLTLQSVMRGGYALVGCVGVLLFANTPLFLGSLWSIPGLVLIVMATPAVVIVFAMIGAFLPDFEFIVQNVMRLGIFLTPVFWNNAGGIRGHLYHWNPFTYVLEIVRQPILDGSLPVQAFMICLCLTALFWALAIVLLGRLRKKVVFAL